MAEIAEDVQEGLPALAVRTGLQVMAAMVPEDDAVVLGRSVSAYDLMCRSRYDLTCRCSVS